MRKASAGNWGKPDKVEKKAELKEDFFQEEPRTKSVAKKKKNKKPYVSPWKLCPFCKSELPLDTKKMEEDKKKGKWVADWLSEYRVKDCPTCGAYEVAKCPACSHKTWYDYVTKIYKHQWIGCGFIGQLKGAENA
jgi:DNA-directed RNA polymerase subunit RPC12/RpoP